MHTRPPPPTYPPTHLLALGHAAIHADGGDAALRPRLGEDRVDLRQQQQSEQAQGECPALKWQQLCRRWAALHYIAGDSHLQGQLARGCNHQRHGLLACTAIGPEAEPD